VTNRIALKQLSASDCTLFEAVFRTISAGNQKSINLNADVLTGKLYPNLSSVAAATDHEIRLALSIYGPGGKPAHKLTRKIIKAASYKNWRLNGEFIYGPPEDSSRYDNIKPGDIAIMVFKGDTAPTVMDLILVSQFDPADSALHKALNKLFGKTMVVVTSAQIATAASAAAVPEGHPVHLAAADPEMEAAFEDAIQGGIEGTRKLLRSRRGRNISSSDLAKAKAKAELTGREGEGLVNGYLAAALAAGKIANYQWISIENAIAPYDFEILTAEGQKTFIDVKTTEGPFENVIHLSLAEIIEAAAGVPYRIYRVFKLDDDGGKLRISKDIGPLALRLKTLHETHMPDGFRVDSFSVATSSFTWGAEKYVPRGEDEETA
jgi:hypothetical protein